MTTVGRTQLEKLEFYRGCQPTHLLVWASVTPWVTPKIHDTWESPNLSKALALKTNAHVSDLHLFYTSLQNLYSMKHLFKRNVIFDKGLEIKLIENTTCVCKDGWLVIPKQLQVHAVECIIITYNTLDIHVLKRWWTLQCTGKVCIPPSSQ
jgi:hypothetical protein